MLFSPNPQRSVLVEGPIDEALIDRLGPEILQLHSQGRTPITVFINSDGGKVSCERRLRDLLMSPANDGDRCHILTVVTSMAGSAAADLLVAGDYAIADPESTIHFHGRRFASDGDLTQETFSSFAQQLRAENESAAGQLLARCEERFTLRILEHTQDGDLNSFVPMLRSKVSPATSHIVEAAEQKALRFRALITRWASKNWTEAQLLRTLITDEFRQNARPTEQRLHLVIEEFLWLRFYAEMVKDFHTRTAYQRWLAVELNTIEFETISDSELVGMKERRFEGHAGFWFFFMGLCHTLQEGENPLSATDALHLGLIDEVIGLPNTSSLRLLLEYAHDPQ
jgi:ATP-dependent protease ClpP protease subunit